MSLNETIANFTSPTPTQFFQRIPTTQEVILAVGVAIIAFVGLTLLYWKQSANIGRKVVIRINNVTPQRVHLKYYWHEIGLHSVHQEFKTAAEAAEYVKELIAEGFK